MSICRVLALRFHPVLPTTETFVLINSGTGFIGEDVKKKSAFMYSTVELEDGVVMIMNNFFFIPTLLPNRVVDGKLINGVFYIVKKAPNGDFESISSELSEKYREIFKDSYISSK